MQDAEEMSCKLIFCCSQVYVASLFEYSCPRVLPGDKLGIYLEETPGSVSYTFDPSSPPLTLGFTYPNLSRPVRPGERVRFESLTFPYVFSAAAFVHLGKCPVLCPTFPRPEGDTTRPS